MHIQEWIDKTGEEDKNQQLSRLAKTSIFIDFLPGVYPGSVLKSKLVTFVNTH